MLDPAIPRHRIENAIEALLALLDASDPDPDLEPSLGYNPFGSDDREYDDDQEVDALDTGDEDATPSLNDRPVYFGEVR